MSPRRKQLLAAAAAALVVAIVLIVVLSTNEGSGSGNDSAMDREEIAAVALAYQHAIDASIDPCKYLDPQSRAFVMAKAHDEPGGPEPCAVAAEQVSGPGMVPPGVNAAGIVFGSRLQVVDCSGDGTGPDHGLPASQRGLRWATAAWAGGAGAQVTFVREDGRWWVDVLICPGAHS